MHNTEEYFTVFYHGTIYLAFIADVLKARQAMYSSPT